MRKLLKQPLALILLLPLVLDLVQPGKAQVTTDSEYVNINGTLYRRCINGYLDGSQNCVAFTTPICPGNQVLVNGLCYNPNQLPTLICPEGYYLYNKLCYPLQPKECPFGSTTTTEATTEEEPYETTPEYEEIEEITEEPETTTTTEEPTTTTTPQPIPPLNLTRCPPDAVVINDQCRKIICAKGEFYNGMCLLPACPEGTVWYREECQPPGYVTTIIQIENRLHNEQRIHKPHFETINVNRVEFKQPTFNGTATPTVTGRPATSFTTSTARSVWTSRPTTERQPEYHDPAPGNITPSGCCTINTPRLCKQYGPKWVCFHKRYKRCNPNICSSNKIYLKAPEINYDSSVLVMPPNPPLRACEVAYCDEGDTVDCSGCAHSDRATCSPYCYSYMCPNGSCSYMDLREYCSIYPGEFGCSRTDGCTWHWCE